MTKPTYTTLDYDPARVGISLVHFGPGAFHRAHQAVYTHDLIAKTGGEYGICGVSLHNPGVRDALRRQDYVYTLAILDRSIRYRSIGSIRKIVVAPESPREVIALLANPTTLTITLTITEKGYTLTEDGRLDLGHPDIVHDLKSPESPFSAVGFLVAGLSARYRAGGHGLTIISCDNLPGNGEKLAGAVLELAAFSDSRLADWIESCCHFPSTMVDSITPATDDDLKRRVEQETGVVDAWPVQREAFTQWVIEDLPGAFLPPWDRVGAILSRNVKGFERAKLRVLNGMHSSMTFLGLLLGLRTVEEAARHTVLRRYLEDMCQDEILPTLDPVEGLDPEAYARSILTRFENPAINHFLSQIAWDSSRKLPIRILDTILSNLAVGRPTPRLLLAVAGWMAMVRQYARNNLPMSDPMAEQLLALGHAEAGVDEFLALHGVFPRELRANADVRRRLERDLARLTQGPEQVIRALTRTSRHP